MSIEIAEYESRRRVALVAERIDIERQISDRYAEIQHLKERRMALCYEIADSLNRGRYQPPELARPKDPGRLGYGVTYTALDARPVPRLFDRLMGRVSGSIRQRR